MGEKQGAAWAIALALAGCGTTQGAQGPEAQGGTSNFAALVSADEALKVVFDEVCVPAILDGGDVEALAKGHLMIEAEPARDATGQTSRAWRLASVGDVTVTAWQDGTCTVGVQRGDPEAHRRHVLAALAARGHQMKPGVSGPAPNDGVRTAYCNDEPRPLLLAVVSPASPKSRRLAIVANLYRAKGRASDLCKAG